MVTLTKTLWMGLLLALGTALGCVRAFAAAKPGTPKPNVLFIAIDDMNDWTTLFDKSNPIRTPNLERLAKRGCFFTRAYCAAPACNPSRTSIMTGLRPTTSGVYGNGDPWRKMMPDAITVSQYFNRHGYATRGAGKIFHHGATGADDPKNPSFEAFFRMLPPRAPKVNYNGYTARDEPHLSKTGYDWGEHTQKMIDLDTVEWVEARMEEKWDRPLFLAAGIFKPHLPFYAPPETFTRYPLDGTLLPPMPKNDLDDVPAIARSLAHTEFFVYSNVTKQPPGSPGSLKRMVQCYQASADFADQMVGRLLDKLEATGRADDTIIVLWADHGYHLGDKESCVKFTLWEKANRVPFLIVAPGLTTPGSRCDRPVGLVDIYPTLIDLAGLPPKEGLDGQSLVPLLKNPDMAWNRPALMTWLRGNHAVRTDRWRYIRYSDGSEELYDHSKDPWEWTNLAGDAQYAQVIAEHRKWLPEMEKAVRTTAQAAQVQGAETSDQRQGAARQPAVTGSPNDILIADFEGKDYGDWKTTGKAFGAGPAGGGLAAGQEVTGFIGRGLVNSFIERDTTTGTLTSPPLKIERKHIHFLIGGGQHPGKTCLNLIVDGKVVRTATGNSFKDNKSRETLDPHSWDVAALAGKTATLQIVDNVTGRWGHILVDRIVQSDTAAAGGDDPRSNSRAPDPPGLLIADFRKTPLPDGWRVEGYAFGSRTPGTERQQAARTTDNQRQYQFGRLTSPEFVIERGYLDVELSGTYHPVKCCVALLVDGRDVRCVSPGRSPDAWSSMDVREFVGKKAQLQVRDDHFNGWVELGRVLQADKPGSEAQKSIPTWEPAVFETKIDAEVLLLPVGGSEAPLQTVVIEIDGERKLEADMPLAMGDTEDFLPAYDLTEYRGKTLRVRYHKTADSRTDQLIRLTAAMPRRPPSDSHPAFHIYCRFGALNDPNGLVYHDGRYHLFHQYAYGPRGKHWAHYVSTDLVHWEERPIGLFPDPFGSMHSGSATVDRFNTAGFQAGERETIVAAFTGSRGMGGNDKLQVQGIAYSTDGGRTFTKYRGNPVLGEDRLKTLQTDNSRDPKVFWYSPTRGMDPQAKDGHWVMVLFEDGNNSIFTSKDLKDWTKTGQVEGFHECPELFELALDGDPAQRRWVMYGASGAYHVGRFDGRTFVPETPQKVPMKQGGGRIYAAQTFDNMPGNPPRRVQVAWQGPQLSFPVKLTLRQTNEGPRLFLQPVAEIERLYRKTHTLDGLTVAPRDANPLADIAAPLLYVEATFSTDSATSVTFDVRGKKIVYDAKTQTLKSLEGQTSLRDVGHQVDLKILVDNWSIDVFGQEGRVYMPSTGLTLAPRGIGVRTDGGSVRFTRLKVHELGSIWSTDGPASDQPEPRDQPNRKAAPK